ncbi:MAG: hypothetical protein OXH95_00940 [bacterium]|nr:hypothetical protein [bacterium]MCY3651863.1 hypothetical protein [bacterium]MDE0642692.1 hypothetical protein [bacterium]
MPDVPPNSEDPVSEHLPWEHLTIPPEPDRRKLIYGVAAGLVVLLLGGIVFRQITRSSSPDLTPVVAVSVAADPVATTGVAPAPAVNEPTPITAPLSEPRVSIELSEADLMAVDQGETERLVMGNAEWLVLEYFTIDPSEVWAERVQTASGLLIPEQLAPESGSETVSYVEWVRTRSLVQTGPSTYLTTVMMRRMVAADGDEFLRLPAEQVEVELRVEEGEVVRAVSLPEITEPASTDLVPMPEGELVWVVDPAGIGWPRSR